jgi:MFS family permease
MAESAAQLAQPRQRSFFAFQGRFFPFIMYSMVMLFLYTSDAIMSFTAPVFIEELVGNTFYMGIILSTSSMVGIACDLLFAQIFKYKSFAFFTFLLIAIAVLFPLSFIVLPAHITTFLFAMASWGIYFELFRFSNFSFVHAYAHPQDHANAWGIIESFRSVAYLIGPIIAGLLVDRHFQLPFYGALSGLVLGFMTFSLFLIRFHKSHHRVTVEKPTHRSLWVELKTWKLLLGRVWPLFLLSTIMVVLDASFWSVGAIVSEELRETSIVGSLLLPAYTVPALFMPLLAGVLSRRFGKKRTAFLTCLPVGLVMGLGALSHNNWIFLGSIFLASVFLSVAYTELYAVFEDYVSRLDEFATDMIGLQAATGSLGYIIGPILAGSVATLVGNRSTFAVFGILLSFTAILAWFAMPRKTRLPQTELQELVS